MVKKKVLSVFKGSFLKNLIWVGQAILNFSKEAYEKKKVNPAIENTFYLFIFFCFQLNRNLKILVTCLLIKIIKKFI